MRKAFRILIALPLVLVVVIALINIWDDTLDPALEKLLTTQPPQIPPEENGYFAWVGVVGPSDQSPDIWGYRWYQQALQADKRQPGENQTLEIESEKPRRDLVATDIPCNKIETCLESVIGAPDNARTLLQKGQDILERGDLAVSIPAYQEAWRPDFSIASHLPSYANLYRQLSATRFALGIAEGRHDEALTHLGQEMAFHVRQMRGASSLIEKLVAMAHLRGDLMLLSQFIRHDPHSARQEADHLATMLAPLPADATQMRSVMEMELRSGARLFLSLDHRKMLSENPDTSGQLRLTQWPDAPLKAFYLPNASANEHFNLYRSILASDTLSGDAYREALTASRREIEAATQNTYVLRNPVGHILVNTATLDYGSYLLRRDDLVALHAMVNFQLDLLRKNISDGEAIDQALSGASLAHPYTGEKPVWDKASRTLSHAAISIRSGTTKTLDIRL